MAKKKNGSKIYEITIIVLSAIILALCIIIVVKRNSNKPDPVINNTPTPSQTESITTEEPTATIPPATATPTPTSTTTPTPDINDLVDFTGRVEHVFFHSLIAFPELAFNQSTPESKVSTTWFKDFVTVSEFNKILEALYKDGYMLVNINDIYTSVNDNGTIKYQIKKFKFPKGKKPLIMSFDDTNYYSNKQGYGTVDKLILNEQGKVVTYTKMKDSREIISDSNEYIPIIEKFVEQHPDFSFNGAKGMICLTGFEGILGYRTHRDSPNRASEIEKVKPIVKALKDTGWYFASHSYKHGNMANYDVESMRDCAQKFKNEVIPLIGETKIYVYPYGSRKAGAVNDVLSKEFGFTYFCGVGADWYIKTREDLGYIILQDRLNLDGFSLMHNSNLIVKYKDWGTPRFPSFNVDEIYSEEDRGISREDAQKLHAQLFNIKPR